MSEQAENKGVPLVAVERGFLDGRMVEPGTSFVFFGKKLPKWAKPKDVAKQELAAKAAKQKAYDTKPKAAQAAIKQKAAELTGSGTDLA